MLDTIILSNKANVALLTNPWIIFVKYKKDPKVDLKCHINIVGQLYDKNLVFSITLLKIIFNCLELLRIWNGSSCVFSV
jgi:hypothetical protein